MFPHCFGKMSQYNGLQVKLLTWTTSYLMENKLLFWPSTCATHTHTDLDY